MPPRKPTLKKRSFLLGIFSLLLGTQIIYNGSWLFMTTLHLTGAVLPPPEIIPIAWALCVQRNSTGSLRSSRRMNPRSCAGSPSLLSFSPCEVLQLSQKAPSKQSTAQILQLKERLTSLATEFSTRKTIRMRQQNTGPGQDQDRITQLGPEAESPVCQRGPEGPWNPHPRPCFGNIWDTGTSNTSGVIETLAAWVCIVGEAATQLLRL